VVAVYGRDAELLAASPDFLSGALGIAEWSECAGRAAAAAFAGARGPLLAVLSRV